MTKKTNPEALNDADLDQTSGGGSWPASAFLKLDDRDMESEYSFDLADSFLKIDHQSTTIVGKLGKLGKDVLSTSFNTGKKLD